MERNLKVARPKAVVFSIYCTVILLSVTPALRAATLTVDAHDATAIPRAIDQAAPGDTIRLPAGEYALTQAIKLKSNLHLTGDDSPDATAKTILRFTGDKPGVLIDLHGCDAVEIANLTLDGDNNPDATQAIVGGDSRHLTLRGLTIRNLAKSEKPGFGPHGVLFSGDSHHQHGVTDSLIENCTFEHIGPGAEWGGAIRFNWGSSRNRVLHNTIRDTGRGGIFGGDSSTDLVIAGNTISGSGAGGEPGLSIEVWHGCDRALIEDNRVDHWISLDNSNGSAVRRNTVVDDSGTVKFIGIEFVNGADGVLTDNVVDGGQTIGISESGKQAKERLYWGYDRVQHCRGWGAQLQGEQGGISRQYFYRCQFSDTVAGQSKYPNDDGHGIRLNGDVRCVTFDECQSTANGRQGVQLGGRNVDQLSFLHCTISGNKGPAVTGPHDYTALEWRNPAVENNARNDLPPDKPFAAPAPHADFAAPSEATAGSPVEFRDVSAAAEGAGGITNRLWDFNDGLPATEAVARHAFSKPGRYRVTLVVWDQAGRGARVEKTIVVSGATTGK
jgi:hypothetical protein